MSEPQENLIQFHSGVTGLADPHPYRAAGCIPEWLKQMPTLAPVPEGTIGTVKNCLPFVDAMGCGYIIPLRATVRFFRRDAVTLEYEHTNWEAHGNAVTYQPTQGYQGAPFQRSIVVKFINHWIVKTPPGYSTLFVPLLNQQDAPFQMLAGLVDTDTYYRPVFFPALCLMQPGTQCIIERGAPLVQAIPVRRDVWKSQCLPVDAEKFERAEKHSVENIHHYRDDNWQKKEYR